MESFATSVVGISHWAGTKNRWEYPKKSSNTPRTAVLSMSATGVFNEKLKGHKRRNILIYLLQMWKKKLATMEFLLFLHLLGV